MVASVARTDSLLKNRLVDAGIPLPDITLRVDINSENDVEEFGCSATTVEVKTLVWEVSCNQNEVIEDELVETFYVVTAQRMTDRVDLSLLRDLVYKHQDLPFGCTPSRLSLAPTEKAEYLTGFQSGCMPPIGHSVPMTLYVEESIADFAIASIGAGSMGHSLLLPMRQLLKFAENNNKGFHKGSFIQCARPQSPSSVLETNSRIRSDKKPKTRFAEPKDRLKEYKSMNSIVEKAKLLRTTARKKGRSEIMKELVDEAVKTADFPQLLLVSEDDGLDKNALHLCSWRGDFETVKLLVETSKRYYPELDIVNMISKGVGNYGKTPIFYALTQCREDVVRYLISEGASLLFINNKGQTPCSIAVSHLEDKACQFLFKKEAVELTNGGRFANFRISHSDEKLYGDLDPRFEIDPYNMGDDLMFQIENYQESLANVTTMLDGFPTNFSPRSLRPTVRWWKRDDRSLECANNGNSAGQITFTQPRPKVFRKSNTEQQTTFCHRGSSPGQGVPKKVLQIESLEVLTLGNVLRSQLSNGYAEGDESRILVNSTETIRKLESEINNSIEFAMKLASNERATSDEVLVESIWGLDCEWQPGYQCGKESPVAILQLSTQNRSFLIDLQCLCQPLHWEEIRDSSVSSEIEVELNCVLSQLFSSAAVSLVGFSVLQDLGKLAASFPHLACFTHYSSVIDLQPVSNIVFPKAERQNLTSLQKMVALLLHRRLDKEQQCSDWARRPLTSKQLDYATLDAAVLPKLLKEIMEMSTVERYNGKFFSTHGSLVSSVRFIFLKDDDPSQSKYKYHVPMGRISNLFSKTIARQSWPSHQDEPDLPKRVLVISRPSKKERAHRRKIGLTTAGGKKPKPMQLKDIMGNLDNLPIPGITLGYTKDSCVNRVVGHEFTNSLPEGTYIGFNRRSGVCETSNAWIIFCNFGGSRTNEGRISSGFLRKGKEFKFTLNPKNFHGKSSEKTLCDFLSSQNGTSFDHDRKILLFARESTRSKYTYCGFCECLGLFPKEGGPVDLLLDLRNYADLVGENRVSEDFLELVGKTKVPL